MLKNLIIKYFLNSTLSSLKGKKRWLVILVLAIANVAQALGFDLNGSLDGFVDAVSQMADTAEG